MKLINTIVNNLLAVSIHVLLMPQGLVSTAVAALEYDQQVPVDPPTVVVARDHTCRCQRDFTEMGKSEENAKLHP